ncbi:DUF3226 domain-containing protein [Bacteroides ndongoniae]|uniref:DUF3226 domain-containing protein n=1 Tax=Bacteroides ndongoniae TaxID=1903262 RepID=UPI0008DB2F93|nr:DUF3226 domain-containing protein [Bacteroides ndongoniae]
MKEDYRIFVEGIADECFLRQLIGYHWGQVKEDSIIITGGYTNLLSAKTGNTYANQMKRNSDDGGVNLVIFDADDDCEKRRKELLEWKNKVGVEFELFLFPDDKAAGELEDLLEQIINSDNRPVMNCWRMYEDSLKDIILPWKGGMPLTIPAKKTKIYAYLEVLLGDSKSEKKKIKEANRDYTNTNHWDLHSQKLWEGILGFLCIHLF